MDASTNFASMERHHNSDVVLLEMEKSDRGTPLARTLSSASDLMLGTGLQKSSRVLTLALVLPIHYMLTCAGPSGMEDVVSLGGPLIGLIGLIAFPLLFSAPFALLISEMCTAYPDDGGFVVWVTNAFGPFWGFQEGYWSWVAAILSNAVYPSYIIDSLSTYTGLIDSPIAEIAIKMTIAMLITLPTLFGAKTVAKTSILMVFVVLAPFIIATLWFFAKAKHYDVLLEGFEETPSSPGNTTSVQWTTLIGRLFWSYDNIFYVSLFGGQVANPSFTYPRAIFITLGLSVVTYVVPLVGAVAVDKVNWREFQDGSFMSIAGILSGSLLRNLLTIASASANAGAFIVQIFAQCYQVNGMAQQGLIPTIFSKRHYFFETPYLALLLNTLPVLLLLTIDFKKLLDATNCLSAASQILLIAAAIRIRLTRGDRYQFQKYPVSNTALVSGMIIPMIVVIGVFIVSLEPIAGAIAVVGVVYAVIARKNWH